MTETTVSEADGADQGTGYAVNAPYYDLIFPEPVRDSLTEVLRLLLPGARAVAETRPGTRQFTEVLARLLGADTDIFAIEPARIMRAALVTRLSRVPEATGTVTVLPEDALLAHLDVPLDPVVVFNLIMHFGPDVRPRLWRKWAQALSARRRDDDLIRWVMTYRTWRGDDLVREETTEFNCHIISDETLAAELSEAGLEPHPSAPEGVQAWRSPDLP
jgi:hypothetical protein